MKYITTLGDREYTIEIIENNRVKVDGEIYEMDFESIAFTAQPFPHDLYRRQDSNLQCT